MPYFWGGVATNWVAWQVPAIAGILLAERIPTHWGLGFAGVLALLGLSFSLLKDRNTWVSGAVAGCAAVAIGLLMEKWLPPSPPTADGRSA